MTLRRRTLSRSEIMRRIRRRPSGARRWGQADPERTFLHLRPSSCLLSIIQSLAPIIQSFAQKIVPLEVLMDTFGFNSQVWYLYVSLSIHFVVKITVDVLLLISRRGCLVRCEESSKPNILQLVVRKYLAS